MTLEKKSWNLLFLFLIIAGISFTLKILAKGYDYTSYLTPIFMLIMGCVLLVEVHLGNVLKTHNLKSLGATQWMTTIVASVAIINAILIIPAVNINILFLNQLSGYMIGFMTLFTAIEWFTQN